MQGVPDRLPRGHVFDRTRHLRNLHVDQVGLFTYICLKETLGKMAFFRFDLDFRAWVYAMEWYTYWYCMYEIMVTMLIVVLNSVLALYAIITVSQE